MHSRFPNYRQTQFRFALSHHTGAEYKDAKLLIWFAENFENAPRLNSGREIRISLRKISDLKTGNAKNRQTKTWNESFFYYSRALRNHGSVHLCA
jgi:hypothetical protein